MSRLALPLRKALAGLLWVVQFIVTREPVQITGAVGGAALFLLIRLGLDSSEAAAIATAVATYAVALVVRMHVSPSAGIITAHVNDDGTIVAPVQILAAPPADPVLHDDGWPLDGPVG